VVVNQDRWLTLGFESFGDPEALEPAISKTANLVLPEILNLLPMSKLAERTSHSYPEML
jgi:hypothetical protein